MSFGTDMHIMFLEGSGHIAQVSKLNLDSKISPTYPRKIPRKFHQQFMKESLSLWGFGEAWGPIFPGYVGKIID